MLEFLGLIGMLAYDSHKQKGNNEFRERQENNRMYKLGEYGFAEYSRRNSSIFDRYVLKCRSSDWDSTYQKERCRLIDEREKTGHEGLTNKQLENLHNETMKKKETQFVSDDEIWKVRREMNKRGIF